MILLIDGDVLLYRFGWRGQEGADWDGDGEKTDWLVNEEMTVDEMHEFIRHLKKTTRCKKARLCLSGPEVFRYDILSTYKHNRKDVQKPQLYHKLKTEIYEHYNVIEKVKLEADDCLGIMSTLKPDKCIIASIDKDLTQIPGWYFNWDKMTEPVYIPEEQANLKFYEQILTGDPGDGFSGVPGIGPVKATKIINEVYADVTNPTEDDFWDAIVTAYHKKELSEEYALKQARMARILRADDWDETNQLPIYWRPGCYPLTTPDNSES